MQTIFEESRPVSRRTVGRAIRIMERIMASNGVTRARDLPEEARVRMLRQLHALFEADQAREWNRAFHSNPITRLLESLRPRFQRRF